jgi:hypothetical protein
VSFTGLTVEKYAHLGEGVYLSASVADNPDTANAVRTAASSFKDPDVNAYITFWWDRTMVGKIGGPSCGMAVVACFMGFPAGLRFTGEIRKEGLTPAGFTSEKIAHFPQQLFYVGPRSTPMTFMVKGGDFRGTVSISNLPDLMLARIILDDFIGYRKAPVSAIPSIDSGREAIRQLRALINKAVSARLPSQQVQTFRGTLRKFQRGWDDLVEKDAAPDTKAAMLTSVASKIANIERAIRDAASAGVAPSVVEDVDDVVLENLNKIIAGDAPQLPSKIQTADPAKRAKIQAAFNTIVERIRELSTTFDMGEFSTLEEATEGDAVMEGLVTGLRNYYTRRVTAGRKTARKKQRRRRLLSQPAEEEEEEPPEVAAPDVLFGEVLE